MPHGDSLSRGSPMETFSKHCRPGSGSLSLWSSAPQSSHHEAVWAEPASAVQGCVQAHPVMVQGAQHCPRQVETVAPEEVQAAQAEAGASCLCWAD
eukprot:825826-Amphidinium_carterae.1